MAISILDHTFPNFLNTISFHFGLENLAVLPYIALHHPNYFEKRREGILKVSIHIWNFTVCLTVAKNYSLTCYSLGKQKIVNIVSYISTGVGKLHPWAKCRRQPVLVNKALLNRATLVCLTCFLWLYSLEQQSWVAAREME